MSRSSVACLVLVTALSSPLTCHGQGWDDSYKLDYSYDPVANNGPDSWSNVEGIGQWAQYNNDLVTGNQCSTQNSRPSPLDLQVTRGCIDIHELLTTQISNDTDCTREDITFEITPYSLRAYYPLSDESCERPSLFMSGRFDYYHLLWMEIHARAEHVVDGKRYDAELQMLHSGTGRDEGQLLTVSLMIDASAPNDNLEFEWLLQQWITVAERESESCDGRRLRKVSEYKLPTKSSSSSVAASSSEQIKTTHRNLQFGPSFCQTDRFGNGCEPFGPRRRMYPYSLWPSIWYYGYTGSLTAPPCSDNVQWRILDEPMRISRRQYKQLTRLLTLSRDDSCQRDTVVSRHGENSRPLQERNQNFQSIYHCTLGDFGYYVFPPNQQ